MHSRQHVFHVRPTRRASLRVQVEVWQTFAALRARHDLLDPEERMPPDRVAATVCPRQDVAARLALPADVFAVILLPRDAIGTTVVAHETQHAAMAWARRRRLDLSGRDGEERMVSAAEHMLQRVQDETRRLGLLAHR